MIVWCDGAYDAPENMRRDRAMLDAAEAALGAGEPFPAVVRLFCFAPPGITLGHAQEAARELDLDRCRRDGVRWATRPTGGRAIFHAEEWTYALVAPIADPEWGGSLAEAYARASAWLCAALVRLGVPAELARSLPEDAGEERAEAGGPAAPCFASTARHEIVRAGRKLVGSAQRRTAHALLQQGSVLLGDGHLRLADYLAVPDARRERIRQGLARASAHAGDLMGPGAALARLADALVDASKGRAHGTISPPDAFPLLRPEGGPYTPPVA